MKLIPCFGVIKGNNEYKSWKYKYQVALSDANIHFCCVLIKLFSWLPDFWNSLCIPWLKF